MGGTRALYPRLLTWHSSSPWCSDSTFSRSEMLFFRRRWKGVSPSRRDFCWRARRTNQYAEAPNRLSDSTMPSTKMEEVMAAEEEEDLIVEVVAVLVFQLLLPGLLFSPVA